MNKKKIIKEKYPPLWIVILMILSMIIGIVLIAIAINKFRNYYHPYWFALVFGGLGLICGTIFAKKIKYHIAVSERLKLNYGPVIMYISTGFIGVFLISGTYINRKLSKIEERDKYEVVDKYRYEGRFRSPEVNTIVVNLKGEIVTLLCSYSYWKRTTIGQDIKLNIYKSKLRFDFVEITDDKK